MQELKLEETDNERYRDCERDSESPGRLEISLTDADARLAMFSLSVSKTYPRVPSIVKTRTAASFCRALILVRQKEIPIPGATESYFQRPVQN